MKNPFEQINERLIEIEYLLSRIEKSIIIKNEINGTPIEFLLLKKRTENCLKNAEIFTIEELVKYGERELLRLRDMGRASTNDIRNYLETKGIVMKW